MSQGQKYIPATPEQTQKQKPQEQKPQEQDTLLGDIQSALQDLSQETVVKLKPYKRCCGILPCKGRTANCYYCTKCLDCITGAGCGHDSSRHDPEASIVD